MNNFLGIIGGVGPFASSYFYDLVTRMTVASKDQDHINMVIFNHATIPDRTAYILGKSKENPYPFLKEDIHKLSSMGASLLFIPCNTSHVFYEELQKETKVPLLNMIEDTISFLKKQGKNKVMILATTGTIRSSLYQNMCEKYQISYKIPSSEIQEKVMYIIYDNVKKGVEIDKKIWNEIVSSDKEVDAYILGCTELSVVKEKLKLEEKFIDPLEIEAKRVIHYFKKKVKER